MTPNKLPPLPESLKNLADIVAILLKPVQWRTYKIGERIAKVAEEMNAAEAIRQSQSLPAGAVAGLVGKWRASLPDRSINWDSSDEAVNECAEELDHALQADEKSESMEFFAVPDDLNPETVNLVARFASALAEKLAIAQRKYGWDRHWQSPSWMDQCRQQLVEHVAKGDPRDVAAYCAFLWHHGESTTPEALQADAREKGDHDCMLSHACPACARCYECNQRMLATQPAQASEKDNG